MQLSVFGKKKKTTLSGPSHQEGACSKPGLLWELDEDGYGWGEPLVTLAWNVFWAIEIREWTSFSHPCASVSGLIPDHFLGRILAPFPVSTSRGSRAASLGAWISVSSQLPWDVKAQFSVNDRESLFNRQHQPQGHCTSFSLCLDSLHQAVAMIGPFIHSFNKYILSIARAPTTMLDVKGIRGNENNNSYHVSNACNEWNILLNHLHGVSHLRLNDNPMFNNNPASYPHFAGKECETQRG